MNNKKWKRFDKLEEKCYGNMIGAEQDGGCWLQAFELLIEIVQEERESNPNFASELEMLEEATDYEYGIQGWLEDCLDEMDLQGNYSTLLMMCEKLLQMFSWPEDTGSDIKARKAAALAVLGKKKESAEFCEVWLKSEPENMVAATGSVYAFMEIKAFAEAEKIVNRFIVNKEDCTEENEIMFIAASTLYQVMGKKKEKKVIDAALKKYEEWLEDYFESSMFEDEDEDDEFWEGELPFN